MIGFGVLIMLLLIAGWYLRSNERATAFIDSIKAQVMWSAVLRTAIQGYLLQILLTFKQLKEFSTDEDKLATSIVALFKLPIYWVLPGFSIAYLFKKRHLLTDPKFYERFGSLYENGRVYALVNKRWPLWNSAIFMMSRLWLALAAVFFGAFLWSQ